MSLKRQYAIRVVYLSNILIAVSIIQNSSSELMILNKRNCTSLYAPDSHTNLSASPSPVSRDSEWAVTGSWPGIWSMALPQPSLVTGTNCCVGIIFDSHFTLYVSLSIMLSVHLTDILWTPDTKLALRAWLLAATSNIRGNAVLFVCISLGSSRDSLEAFKNLSTFLIWMQYLFNNC